MIERLLHEEIQNELKELAKMDVGSDEYKTAVDGIAKLMNLKMDRTKFEAECQEKTESRKLDAELKLKQMDEDRKGRIVRDVLTAMGIVIPAALAIWGTKASFEFEKEGTITTIMGRGFINKLLPKK
jgi:hypothetical protein